MASWSDVSTDAPELAPKVQQRFEAEGLALMASVRRDGSLPPWADLTGPGIHLLKSDPGYVARAAEHGHDTYCWSVEDPSGLVPNDPQDVLLCRRLGVRYFATNSPIDTLRVLGTGEDSPGSLDKQSATD